jgi:hypothetical protein
MKTLRLITIILLCTAMLFSAQLERKSKFVTVPFKLDHNRMLVEAEVQSKDGTWCKALLWVDTGNPNFYISSPFAKQLGVDLSAIQKDQGGNVNPDIPPPTGVRIGGMDLDFSGVKTKVMCEPFWLFSTMHNDANLPSTVLQRYHIIFDYPKKELTIAEHGTVQPRGTYVPASVNPKTGIVQIDATIDGEKFGFALDNGASYSFVSDAVLDRFSKLHPDWSHMTGTLGCANMWGWWPPDEQTLPVMRIPEIVLDKIQFDNIGIVGVHKFSQDGPTLGEWYSQKTARPVDGFLGPNAFNTYRVDIDYADSAVYFEKRMEADARDMDIVGLTLQPQADGKYMVIGIAEINGKPTVDKVKTGDMLLEVGRLKTTDATMGKVIDALRGKPSDVRTLTLERNGKRIKIKARVNRFL